MYRPDAEFKVANYGDGNFTSTAIQEAIDACSLAGGGKVVLQGATYIITETIVLKRLVTLIGQGIDATTLKAADGLNDRIIISENFDSLIGTGKAPSLAPDVPFWYGLKDMYINGNSENQNPEVGEEGRCDCVNFYGTAIRMDNVVVENALNDNIVTEGSMSGGGDDLYSQEEAWFRDVTSRNAGRHGWFYRGSKDAHLENIVILISGVATGWGWYQTRGDGTNGNKWNGGVDKAGLIHVYSKNSLGATNRNGIYIGATLNANNIYADGVSMYIPNISGRMVNINQARVSNVGINTNYDGLVVEGDGVHIGVIDAKAYNNGGEDHCDDNWLVDWSGDNGSIGEIKLNGQGKSVNGIKITGGQTKVLGGHIKSFSQSGRKGVLLDASRCNLNLNTENCDTHVDYVSGSRNRVDLTAYRGSGEIIVGTSAPHETDTWNVKLDGISDHTNPSKEKSATVDMTTTSVQTIQINHDNVFTPTSVSQIMHSFYTEVDPNQFAWDIHPYVAAFDDTKVVLKCKLGAAASTGVGTIGVRVEV